MQDICSLVKHLKIKQYDSKRRTICSLPSKWIPLFFRSYKISELRSFLFLTEELVPAQTPNSRTIHTMTRRTARNSHASSNVCIVIMLRVS